MLTFNALLVSVGLDPTTVRLVRHKHGREYQRVMYRGAIRGEPRFEQYQAGQCNVRVIELIKSAAVLAAFVVDPAAQTVFVGLWRVGGCRKAYVPDPYYAVPGPARGDDVTFDLERMQELAEYRGRIVVDWGGGERAWVQYASRRDKQIVELKRRAEEEAFPGLGRFGCGLHEIDSLPTGWLGPLQATRGVYLLVHRSSVAQYVGSATGADGFLGRWRSYADGHGGNIGLRDLGHAADQFDVRILETVGSSATVEDVIALETGWKEKLGSRTKGLNRN
jgi:hypothetical protein